MSKNESSLTDLRSGSSVNNTSAAYIFRSLSSTTPPSRFLESGSLLSGLEAMKGAETISVAIGDSSVILVTPHSQELHSLASPGLEDGVQNAKSVPLDISSTVAAVRYLVEYNGETSKIVGIVVPFTCVIMAAGLLFLTWKLCHKYNKCHNNHKGLQKIALFCDSCMTTRSVFHESSTEIKNTSISSTRSSYSFRSVLSSPTSSSITPSSFKNNPQPRSPIKGFIPNKYCKDLSPFRQGSAVYRLENTSAVRKLQPYSSRSPRNSTERSRDHQKPIKVHSYGRLSNQNARCVPRQTVGIVSSGRSGRPSTSVEAPLQPHAIPALNSRY